MRLIPNYLDLLVYLPFFIETILILKKAVLPLLKRRNLKHR